MAATTIKNRINDLIGDLWEAELNSELELVCAGFNEVADILPNKLFLKYISDDSNTNVITTPGVAFDGKFKGKKIILVTRVDVTGTIRTCVEIPYSEGLSSTDTDSIYFKDPDTDRFPQYYIDPTGDITYLPNTTSTSDAKAYVFSYFKASDATSILDYTSLGDKGFPQEAEYAGCLKATINIMNAKVSTATQEEEDAELLSLLQTQATALIASYNSEAKRLTEITQ